MTIWQYMTINICYQWLPEEMRYRVWHSFQGEEPDPGREACEEETFSHGEFAGVLHCFLRRAGARGWELVSLPAIRDDGETHFLIIVFKCPEAMHASSVEC